MFDPRIVTALALLIVGFAALTLAFRILWTHPINRAFGIGPFVTERGLRALLGYTPTIVALGSFAVVSGLSHLTYTARWEGYISTDTANVVGVIEAGTALWAGGAVLVTAWRLWRGA